MTKRNSKRVTILDVALEAGVSKSAVSDIVNRGHLDPYPQATRDRVGEAVRRVGYRPHRAAQRMRSGKSNVVGVLLTRGFGNPFFARLFDLIGQGLNGQGYTVDLLPVSRGADDLLAAIQIRDLDAVVVGPLYAWDRRLATRLERILAGSVKITTFGAAGAGLAGHPHVCLGDEGAGRVAARYLLGLGHRRIAIFGACEASDRPLMTGTMQQGVESAIGEARGTKITNLWVCGDEGDYASCYATGRLCVAEFQSTPAERRPTAIVAKNDQMAIALLRALLEAGVSVPGDVSLLGYDNAPEAAFTWPPLSSIDTRVAARMQEVVWQSLRQLDSGSGATGSPPNSNETAEVVVRGSTASP